MVAEATAYWMLRFAEHDDDGTNCGIKLGGNPTRKCEAAMAVGALDPEFPTK